MGAISAFQPYLHVTRGIAKKYATALVGKTGRIQRVFRGVYIAGPAPVTPIEYAFKLRWLPLLAGYLDVSPAISAPSGVEKPRRSAAAPTFFAFGGTNLTRRHCATYFGSDPKTRWVVKHCDLTRLDSLQADKSRNQMSRHLFAQHREVHPVAYTDPQKAKRQQVRDLHPSDRNTVVDARWLGGRPIIIDWGSGGTNVGVSTAASFPILKSLRGIVVPAVHVGGSSGFAIAAAWAFDLPQSEMYRWVHLMREPLQQMMSTRPSARAGVWVV